MACWALWQRLPPRYQLTAKDFKADEADFPLGSPRTPRTPRSPRAATPRSNNSHRASEIEHQLKHSQKRPQSARSTRSLHQSSPRSLHQSSPRSLTCSTEGSPDTPRGQATMYFTVSSPQDVVTDTSCSPRTSFPVRTSSFVRQFKQQQRINSARQQFQDPSTAHPIASSSAHPMTYTPTMRVRTSQTPQTSQFPVTHLASHHSEHSCHQTPAKGDRLPHELETSAVGISSPRRLRASKSAGSRSHRGQLAISTIVPFETNVKPFVKNPLYPDANTKRYIVRGMNNATMFIDNDKVVVIKNSKSHQQDSDESTSYIAHLRKLYLESPRDLAKINKPNKNNASKQTLIRERLEYEKRTGHILNYYNSKSSGGYSPPRADYQHHNTRASTPATNTRASSGRDRHYSSFTSQTRARSQSAKVNKSPSRTFSQQYKERTPSGKQDALADWDTFLKINSQSTLYDRQQFYLQTPATPPHTEVTPRTGGDTQRLPVDCECQLCRLEEQLNHVHGQETECGVIQNLHDPSYNSNDITSGKISPTHDKPCQQTVQTDKNSPVTSSPDANAPGFVVDLSKPAPNVKYSPSADQDKQKFTLTDPLVIPSESDGDGGLANEMDYSARSLDEMDRSARSVDEVDCPDLDGIGQSSEAGLVIPKHTQTQGHVDGLLTEDQLDSSNVSVVDKQIQTCPEPENLEDNKNASDKIDKTSSRGSERQVERLVYTVHRPSPALDQRATLD